MPQVARRCQSVCAAVEDRWGSGSGYQARRMPLVRRSAGCVAVPAEGSRRAGDGARRVRLAVQLLLCSLPDAAHTAIGTISGSANLSWCGGGFGSDAAARADAVAGASAAGPFGRERADAGAVASVVAGNVHRERILEGSKGGVFSAGERVERAAVFAREIRRRWSETLGRAAVLCQPAVDTRRVRSRSVLMMVFWPTMSTRRGW